VLANVSKSVQKSKKYTFNILKGKRKQKNTSRPYYKQLKNVARGGGK